MKEACSTVAIRTRCGALPSLWSFLLVTLASCGGGKSDGAGPPSTSQLLGIDLSQATDSIVQHIDEHAVALTLRYSGAAPAETDVRISSANPASLRADTTIKAARGSARFSYRGLAPGVAAITVSADGRSSQLVITVLREGIAFVVVSPEFPLLAVDDSVQLATRVLGVNRDEIAGIPVTWSVGDPTIATISASGMLVGTGIGLTSVTARDTEVGKTGSTTVRVTMPQLSAVAISPSPATVLLGRKADFSATGVDGKGRLYPGLHANWSVDDTTLLLTFPDTGVTYTLNVGRALLRAVVGGVSGTLPVTILPNPVGRILVNFGVLSGWNGDSLLMWSGDFADAYAQAYDTTGHGIAFRPVQWSSTDPSVATVTTAGVIHAVAPGVFNVVATIDGASRAAPGRVRLTPPVISVLIGSSHFVRVTGQTMKLRATVLGLAGVLLPDRPVAWTSTTRLVGRITDDGVLTAVSPGTTVITASSGGRTSDPLVLTVLGDEPGSEWNPVVRIDGPEDPRLVESIRRAIVRLRYVIRGDQPDIPITLTPGACYPGSPAVTETVDDLLVLVRYQRTPSLIGTAGACVVRSAGSLPVVSVIQLDTIFIRNNRDDVVDDVVLHNLLHALGMTFPTWNSLSIWSGPGADPAFFGPTAQAAFRAAGGLRYPYRIVPTEDGGQDVDLYMHWRSSIMRPEIFTTSASIEELHPFSEITIGALADLGYQVAANTSDDFHLGPQVPLVRPTTGLHLDPSRIPDSPATPKESLTRQKGLVRVPKGS